MVDTACWNGGHAGTWFGPSACTPFPLLVSTIPAPRVPHSCTFPVLKDAFDALDTPKASSGVVAAEEVAPGVEPAFFEGLAEDRGTVPITKHLVARDALRRNQGPVAEPAPQFRRLHALARGVFGETEDQQRRAGGGEAGDLGHVGIA